MKFSQESNTERVKCCHEWGPDPFGKECVYPVSHLTCRLVGECHCEDRPSTDTLLDKMCNSVRDRLGLARTRPCHNEKWTLRVERGFLLSVVEAIEVPCLVCHRDTIAWRVQNLDKSVIHSSNA